jgi:hypothetical protein
MPGELEVSIASALVAEGLIVVPFVTGKRVFRSWLNQFPNR